MLYELMNYSTDKIEQKLGNRRQLMVIRENLGNILFCYYRKEDSMSPQKIKLFYCGLGNKGGGRVFNSGGEGNSNFKRSNGVSFFLNRMTIFSSQYKVTTRFMNKKSKVLIYKQEQLYH